MFNDPNDTTSKTMKKKWRRFLIYEILVGILLLVVVVTVMAIYLR